MIAIVKHKIEDFPKGWFVGSFKPTLVENKDVEVSIKYYKAGDKEESHVHKIATEYTAIVSGKVTLNGIEFSAGEIAEVLPYCAVEFISITDSATVVVKTPSVPGDKYPAKPRI